MTAAHARRRRGWAAARRRAGPWRRGPTRDRSWRATAGCGFRLCDLGQWLWEEVLVAVSLQRLSRARGAIGHCKLSAPPGITRRRLAPSRRSKNFPATLAGSARERGLGLDQVEIWFADEARVGQKNGITRRWARRGTKPSAPQDQRYASVYIFGAVCPKEGEGAALVLPFCNTAAMNLHLAEISAMVSPGQHAAPLLDPAGSRLSGDVTVPANITLLPLPPTGPELNVMENVCGSCATTGRPTGCSAITTTSSRTAAITVTA